MTKHAKVRINFDLLVTVDREWTDLAAAHGTTKADIIRRAMRLFAVALEAERRGLRLAVVDPAGHVMERLVSL